VYYNFEVFTYIKSIVIINLVHDFNTLIRSLADTFSIAKMTLKIDCRNCFCTAELADLARFLLRRLSLLGTRPHQQHFNFAFRVPQFSGTY
jgi:hypothetical protein